MGSRWGSLEREVAWVQEEQGGTSETGGSLSAYVVARACNLGVFKQDLIHLFCDVLEVLLGLERLPFNGCV